MEKSLARLVYETWRSLEGRAHQVEKRRVPRGQLKPDYKGTPKSVRGIEKGDKNRRYRRRERGEVSEQSLIEEIEGSGVLGSLEGDGERERARKRLAELGGALTGGLSGLAGRIAAKRAR